PLQAGSKTLVLQLSSPLRCPPPLPLRAAVAKSPQLTFATLPYSVNNRLGSKWRASGTSPQSSAVAAVLVAAAERVSTAAAGLENHPSPFFLPISDIGDKFLHRCRSWFFPHLSRPNWPPP
ncbi:unnamed protein product, partial [Ectocarpus sp. 13 AM-2016]